MLCYRGIMHKMNKIHERSLRLLLKNYKDDFQNLLRFSVDISIHQRCINSLLTEVYKYIHGLSHEIINEFFSTRANICNTRQIDVTYVTIMLWLLCFTQLVFLLHSRRFLILVWALVIYEVLSHYSHMCQYLARVHC